jgi:hypothetical protein
MYEHMRQHLRTLCMNVVVYVALACFIYVLPSLLYVLYLLHGTKLELQRAAKKLLLCSMDNRDNKQPDVLLTASVRIV